MKKYHPERVLVHKGALSDAATQRILDNLGNIPVRIYEEEESVIREFAAAPDPIVAGKDTLLLKRHSGKFINDCLGSGADMCCGYLVANYANNCHMDCTYCILPGIHANPGLTVFTNIEDLLQEVKTRVGAAPKHTFRIGTGDMADSLALDHITHYSKPLIELFASLPNAVLELKTKSDQVDNLEGLNHRRRTIVSWSLNSKSIIRNEERKTASLEERLEAANRCQKWGYRIGIHFDPLIYYEGWEGDYREVVDTLFEFVNPANVAWISLGCLRFSQKLRAFMRKRFPKSRIPYGEFVFGHHNKLRYFRPIREELYCRMQEWISKRAPEVFVYLCMENQTPWQNCIDHPPANALQLSDQLDERVNMETRKFLNNKPISLSNSKD